MTLDELIKYCLAKPAAEETYPWGDGELVCKVGGKAFAFIGLESRTVGLKCGPTAEATAEWRDRYRTTSRSAPTSADTAGTGSHSAARYRPARCANWWTCPTTA